MPTPDDLSAAALVQALQRMPDYRPRMLDREDLAQEASLAIWQAGARVDRSRPPPSVMGFLVTRGVGAMRDAIRTARFGTRNGPEPVAVDIDLDALDGFAIDATQETQVQLARACESICRMPAPLPAVAMMTLAGMHGGLVATHLGIPESRVSQYLQAIAAALQGPGVASG